MSDLKRDRGSILLFLGLFGLSYAILYWLLNGSGPLPFVNQGIDELTRAQASIAGHLLRALGEQVTSSGTALIGQSFSCDVNEGCNGMSAVVLLLAGLLSFPATFRNRLLGGLVLIPTVFVVNVVRIAGLYLVGSHAPAWFVVSHVYVGQVLVILVSASLWWSWLSWSFRGRRPSSSPSY
jgi:exosortase/archaeosortase family protein